MPMGEATNKAHLFEPKFILPKGTLHTLYYLILQFTHRKVLHTLVSQYIYQHERE